MAQQHFEDSDEEEWEDGFFEGGDEDLAEESDGELVLEFGEEEGEEAEEVDNSMEISEEDASSKTSQKKKKKKQRGWVPKAEDKLEALNIHRSDLCRLIARTSLTEQWCFDQLVFARLLSFLPPHLHDEIRTCYTSPGTGEAISLHLVSRIVEWFTLEFPLHNEPVTFRASRDFKKNMHECNCCGRPSSAKVVEVEGNTPMLSACARCKNVFYCSKECQTLHWKQDHVIYCKSLSSFSSSSSSSSSSSADPRLPPPKKHPSLVQPLQPRDKFCEMRRSGSHPYILSLVASKIVYGTKHELTQLLLILLRGLGIHARYVVCLDPLKIKQCASTVAMNRNMKGKGPKSMAYGEFIALPAWIEVFAKALKSTPVVSSQRPRSFNVRTSSQKVIDSQSLNESSEDGGGMPKKRVKKAKGPPLKKTKSSSTSSSSTTTETETEASLDSAIEANIGSSISNGSTSTGSEICRWVCMDVTGCIDEPCKMWANSWTWPKDSHSYRAKSKFHPCYVLAFEPFTTLANGKSLFLDSFDGNTKHQGLKNTSKSSYNSVSPSKVVDVSRRYLYQKWSLILSLRGQPSDRWWWKYTLQQVNNQRLESYKKIKQHRLGTDNRDGKTHENAITILEVEGEEFEEETSEESKSKQLLAKKAEEDEMRSLIAKEPLPTSLQGFKTHQLFVLERFLSKFDYLPPDTPKVGLFRGEAVYEKRKVQTLKTKQQWRREMKEVKPSELDTPVKLVDHQTPQKRKRKSNSTSETSEETIENSSSSSSSSSQVNGNDEEEGPFSNTIDHEHIGDEKKLKLYGVWQTRPWMAPDCCQGPEGKLPRNEHGNYELWGGEEKLLPKHTVWLRMPKVAIVAKNLGLDFVPVLVGFSRKPSRTVPDIQGIMVHEDVKDVLVEAYTSWAQELVRQEALKHQKVVFRRWELLVRNMMTRQRLQDEYGKF